MEACKKDDDKRKRVYRKLRRRAAKRAAARVRNSIDSYIERQIQYGRVRNAALGITPVQHQTYHVKHDYTVEPVDPYAGEDLVNIDHMSDDE